MSSSDNDFLRDEYEKHVLLYDVQLNRYRLLGYSADQIAAAFQTTRRRVLDQMTGIGIWDGPLPAAAQAYKEEHRRVTIVREGNDLVLRPSAGFMEPPDPSVPGLRVPLEPEYI